jgi:hypothetical protein
MNKLLSIVSFLLIVAITAWFVGCTKDVEAPSPVSATNAKITREASTGQPSRPSAPATPCNGTTLNEVFVPSTATCFNYYEWTCTDVIGAPDCVPPGHSTDVTATVTVKKGTHVAGWEGTLCITNGGAVATTDLKVGFVLESKSGSGQFASTGVTVTGLEAQHPVLAAGETHCYTYSFQYPAMDENVSYRLNTEGFVTITNHSGSGFTCGTPQGPNEKTISEKGCAPSNNCIDVTGAMGTLYNSLTIADNTSFTFGVSTTDETHLCADGVVNFTVHVTNVSAPAQETWTGSFTSNVGTGDGSSSCSADFGVNTLCYQDGHCTYTQGFWKTHGCVGPAGKSQYGQNPDLISPLLADGPIVMGNRVVSTCGDAGAVFQGAEGNAGNAIKRLYSQMLAALLNKKNGSDGSCVADAIAAANAVLSAADPNGDASGWATISGANRAAVQSAASTFDQYNNGLSSCSSHCQ